MRTEGITDKPVRLWELPGAVRRDCEPHRGKLLLRLSMLTAGLAASGAVLLITALLAVPLAAAIFAVARHDLASMRRGVMAPAGEADTDLAKVVALYTALLTFYALVALAAVASLVI